MTPCSARAAKRDRDAECQDALAGLRALFSVKLSLTLPEPRAGTAPAGGVSGAFLRVLRMRG